MDLTSYSHIKIASSYSEGILISLQERLKHNSLADHVCVIAVGSFARHEASEFSDLDFFVLFKTGTPSDDSDVKNICEEVKGLLTELGIRQPAAGGAFGNGVDEASIIGHIGGLKDANECLTRRMLFLFESRCLLNQKYYDEVFSRVINCYIRDSITEHQLCRFLLNDLIRYYRTICVDFEHKTVAAGKSWGDRNIKLMFSRKLLYFSGILAIAETAQHTCATKREVLKELLMLSPVMRISTICGVTAADAFKKYDIFLKRLGEKTWRDLLVGTSEDRNTHDLEFRNFKNEGHHFSWALARLLNQTYDSSHPIHNALVF